LTKHFSLAVWHFFALFVVFSSLVVALTFCISLQKLGGIKWFCCKHLLQ